MLFTLLLFITKILMNFKKLINSWNVYFEENKDIIFLGKDFKDIEKAKLEK